MPKLPTRPAGTSITFDRVTKSYRLGEGLGSLRGALGNLQRRLLHPSSSSGDSQRMLRALDTVSFSIGKGESVGLIGPNGAGKTTILKLVSNVAHATAGRVVVDGRVSALIELGAGFHPDLTGRENVYFNGAILGMQEREVRSRFDAIVDFSGLERFLDTPVKRYSSGMYCRLGFAVAAHVNPDILLIDEVLAVGDAAFQSKCLKRMADLKAAGTTVVFVTHDLGYLQRLCKRAIFLKGGRIQADGDVSEVIAAYRDDPVYLSAHSDMREEDLAEGIRLSRTGTGGPIAIDEVFFTSEEGRAETVCTGAPVTIHMRYRAAQPVTDVMFQVWIYGLDGAEYASFATAWDGVHPLISQERGEISLTIDPVCLMPGTYFVNVAVSDSDGLDRYDQHWERYRLLVLSGPISYGLLYLPHRWNVAGNPVEDASCARTAWIERS